MIDPFDYPEQYSKEEWKKIRSRANQKAYRDRIRGGPPVPKVKKEKKKRNYKANPDIKRVFLKLSTIQIAFLSEMGNGNVMKGIQELVNKHTELK